MRKKCGKKFSTYGKLQYGKIVEKFFSICGKLIVEKLWKSFFHMWKITLWKKYGKIPTCGKRMWKSGKYVENYAKGKMHKKIALFCAKGRTKIFLKKTEKKEGKQESFGELLHCNV